jgi:hypothetical protein
MTTFQTTLTAARFRRTSAVVTVAGALIAIGIAALFLTLGGPEGSSHTAVRHSAPIPYHRTYSPQIQRHATVVPAAPREARVADAVQGQRREALPAPATGARPTAATLLNPRKSYGAIP